MTPHFDETITTRKRLRELHGTAMPASAGKAINHIDDICRRFIAASPFVLVGTRGADGRLDLSPKGDPAGFVTVLDEQTLAIPDRLGNNRLDTFENLLVNPEIGLIFLIPGNGDTLRVSGKGQIVRDSRLQSRMAVNGKMPKVVLIVRVEEAFMHCPKCIVRAALWKQDQWPDRSDVPTLGEALVKHPALGEALADVQARIDKDGATRLY